MKNSLLLVKKSEYSKNWQHPKLVTEYVTENLKNIRKYRYI